MRSKLKETEKGLIFKEYEMSSETIIPEIVSADRNIAELIKKCFSPLLYTARYNHGFLSLFVICVTGGHIKAVCVLDHTIADGSCISLIKRKFSRYSQDKNYHDTGLKYCDYCRTVSSLNTNIDKVFNNWYISGLKECMSEDKDNLIARFQDEGICLEENLEKKDSIDISMQIAFLIAQEIGKSVPCEKIAVRTLFNIRDFPSYSFRETIGDVHVGMSFIYQRGMGKNEFYDQAKKNT